MKKESTANKVGFVVMERTKDGKERKISAPFLCESAAVEFVRLAKQRGCDAFIVGPGRKDR